MLQLLCIGSNFELNVYAAKFGTLESVSHVTFKRTLHYFCLTLPWCCPLVIWSPGFWSRIWSRILPLALHAHPWFALIYMRPWFARVMRSLPIPNGRMHPILKPLTCFIHYSVALRMEDVSLRGTFDDTCTLAEVSQASMSEGTIVYNSWLLGAV